MNTTRDIPRVGDLAGIAQPDLDAQIHRLPPRIAHVARALGFGQIHPSGSWRYSLREGEAAREESKRRTTAKKLPRQRRGVNIFPPSALSDVDLALSTDRLDRVEQILFRGALMATYLDAFDTLRSATDAGRVEPLASQRAIAKRREVQTAGKVLKAKHDTVPSCFSECPQKR